MEPDNALICKGNSSSKLSFSGSFLIFRGVYLVGENHVYVRTCRTSWHLTSMSDDTLSINSYILSWKQNAIHVVDIQRKKSKKIDPSQSLWLILWNVSH